MDSIALISPFRNVASLGQNSFTLFNGDGTPLPTESCAEYSVQEKGTGVGGSVSLKLTPDAWHTALLKVYCGNRPRTDLGVYANLTFMIRSSSINPDPVSVSFYTFGGYSGQASSKTISINPYIQSGSVGTDWRQVTIPMSVFKTDAWNVSNVDGMLFSASPSSSIYFVDNIVFQPEIVPVAPPPVVVPTVPAAPTVAWTLFNGDSIFAPSSCVEYGVQAGVRGIDSSVALKLTPDPWHAPILKVYCDSRARTDLGVYTNLTFIIRSESINPDPVSMSFYTFAGPNGYMLSRTISINPYIQSGSVGTDWRQVTIPMSVFKTDAWNISNVDAMSFSTSPSSSVYYIDDVIFHPSGDIIVPPIRQIISGNLNVVTPGTLIPVVVPMFPTVPPPIVIPVTPTTTSINLTKQFKIWTGESSAEQTVAITNGSIVSSGANTGSYSLKASPNQYTVSSLSLANLSAVYRKSLSQYDTLTMMVKVIPNAGTLIPSRPTGRFILYGWPNVSASVPIEDYLVDGGVLGTSYKMIKIPMNLFKVPGGFDLSSIETLWFGATPGTIPTYSFQIDDIYAIKSSPNYITNVKTISDRVIRITTGDRYDMNEVIKNANYTLTGAGDTNYAQGKYPVSVGREFHVNDFETSTGGSYGLSKSPIIESNLYLVFDMPMVNGSNYALTVKNIPDLFGNNFTSPKTIPITYNDSLITGSVQVNQVGYLPVSSKFAYIGNYLGDAGALRGIPRTCKVINATLSTLVVEFPVIYRASDAALSGNNVYNCDFSSITNIGTYYIYVPGFGRSYSFKIGSSIYNDVSKKLMNFYYSARANMSINYDQWSYPAGTLSSDKSAVLHPINFVYSADNPLAVSRADYPDGTTFDMTGGWYDAGDYGKYVLPASGPVNELLFAYELYPQKFTDGQANIPEKNNGIPDILDEIKYEVDWFSKMQAKDGGVFDRLTSQQWETNPYDIQTRYLSPKSTHTTAVYAAVLAQASRVFKNNASFEATYPGYADALLLKARKAWNFLQLHPTPLPANGIDVKKLGIGGGDYQDIATSNCDGDQVLGVTCPHSDTDNRAWAAAELYKTTGETSYANAFKTYWQQSSPFYNMYNNFVYHNAQASLTYVTISKYPTDPTIIRTIKDAYKIVADEEYGYTHTNTYRVGYRMDVPSYIGWGQFAHSASRSYHLVIAYELLGDTKYLDAAKINFDVQLGANPQNQSYITGVGSSPPKNPLHLTSIWLRQNNIATMPIPGIPVFGPHYHASNGNDFGAAVQSNTNVYPSIEQGVYPILRRYFDVSAVVEQSEFGIGSIAPILAGFIYFTN